MSAVLAQSICAVQANLNHPEGEESKRPREDTNGHMQVRPLCKQI